MLPKRKDTKAFLPIVKFNALEGTFVHVDRTQDESGGWKTELHEIEVDDFEFVADMPNLEIGWIISAATGRRPILK